MNVKFEYWREPYLADDICREEGVYIYIDGKRVKGNKKIDIETAITILEHIGYKLDIEYV